MTEAELTASAALFFDLQMTSLTLYFSVCSAYLVTAYAVGSRLNRFQASVTSCLFIFISLISCYSFFGWGTRAFRYNDLARELEGTSLIQSGNADVVLVLCVIMLLGTLGCLTFMWDVRQKKSTTKNTELS